MEIYKIINNLIHKFFLTNLIFFQLIFLYKSKIKKKFLIFAIEKKFISY